MGVHDDRCREKTVRSALRALRGATAALLSAAATLAAAADGSGVPWASDGVHGDPDPVPAALRWIPAEAPVPALLRSGTAGAFIGVRSPGGPAWDHLSLASQVGFDLTLGDRAWWVRPTLGAHYAKANGSYRVEGEDREIILLGTVREPGTRGVIDASILECAAGVRGGWAWGPLRHTIGGGLCWVRATLTDTPSPTIFDRVVERDGAMRSASDDGLGFWLASELTVHLGGLEVGAAGRYTDARVAPFDAKLQAGGWQAGGILAITW